MNLLINVLISGAAVLIAARLLGGVSVDGYGSAVAVAVVLGIVNAVLGPLLAVLTVPINVLTLGLFSFVVMAGLVMLVPAVVPGFKVAGFGWALAFACVLALVNSGLHALARA